MAEVTPMGLKDDVLRMTEHFNYWVSDEEYKAGFNSHIKHRGNSSVGRAQQT